MVGYEDELKKTIGTVAIVGGTILLLLIVVFGSFYTIGAGERGVLTTFGKPDLDAKEEGLHFKIPIIQGVTIMDIKTQTVKFDNMKGKGDDTESSSLFSASKDLQDVQVAVVVNYHIIPDKSVEIYKTFGTQDYYKSNIIEPIIRGIVKATSAEYTADELVKKRLEVQNVITKKLSEKFETKSAVLEEVNVVNFQFSESFTKAIEAKVTAEQNALAAQNKLAQVKFEADQRVAQANGEAEAIKIQASAIQAQGGAAYVQLQAISKWDGHLPNINVAGGNNGLPFLLSIPNEVGEVK